MSPKDPSGTDALAAELRRIVEQAEELMAAAGAENVTLGGLKDRVNDTIERGARETRRPGAGSAPARTPRGRWPPNPGSVQTPGRPGNRRRRRSHRRRPAHAQRSGAAPDEPQDSNIKMIPGLTHLRRTWPLAAQTAAGHGPDASGDGGSGGRAGGECTQPRTAAGRAVHHFGVAGGHLAGAVGGRDVSAPGRAVDSGRAVRAVRRHQPASPGRSSSACRYASGCSAA